ncbi:MAG: polysaccharide biosynthesis protein [Planctomycetota bacterium]|nr:polysaccharide biosynthesis protein [Planctomycetota bacterium]
MPRTAILIGQPELCRRLEEQLDLLTDRPKTIGWIVTGVIPAQNINQSGCQFLGSVDQLEDSIEKHQPELALICLPAAMNQQVVSIRTRLRKMGVPDRYMPTLEDQLEGVGPRTQIEIDPSELIERAPRQIDEAAIRSVIENKIVLITGAAGSIVSELARICATYDPKRILFMDRSENALFEIDRQIARLHPNLERKAILHDIVEAEETRRLFHKHLPQVIFHTAAHKHVPMMEDHPGAAVDNNFFGTKAVADAAHASRAERFVMISTDKAVNPSSIMGATKRLAEQYVQFVNQERISETAFSIVRFGNVLGSSGSVLETWSQQIALGGPLTVTDERMTRYFMTIPEAASLVIQSAALVDETADHGEVFLLDMGDPVNILDLSKRYISMHGLEPWVRTSTGENPASGHLEIVITGARPGEKLHESLAYDAEAMRPTRHGDINIWRLAPPDRRYIEEVLNRLNPQMRPTDPQILSDLIRSLIPEMAAPIAA